MVVQSIKELIENLQDKLHEKDKLWYFLLQPMREYKPYSLVKWRELWCEWKTGGHSAH